ncbi:MAG: 4Fe-4S single cluster domain-containing protein [Deltaproteobacteria bacterium]
MAPIRIAAVVPVTEAEGPGTRFAVWVQGCSLRCPGCCNPHMFDPAGGIATGADALLSRLDEVRDQVEGVTLLGGEPFEQAGALAPFARGVRERGLSLVAFTGYRLDELRADRPPGSRDLLAWIDLLVDGPYVGSLPEVDRRWSGSANQQFRFLTGRYSPGVETIVRGGPERTVELRLAPDGTLERSGWPEA